MSQILALAAPAAVLCGWFLRSRFGITAVSWTAAVVSIGATFGAWAAGRWAESERWTGLVGMLELASLLVLVVLTLRAEGAGAEPRRSGRSAARSRSGRPGSRTRPARWAR